MLAFAEVRRRGAWHVVAPRSTDGQYALLDVADVWLSPSPTRGDAFRARWHRLRARYAREYVPPFLLLEGGDAALGARLLARSDATTTDIVIDGATQVATDLSPLVSELAVNAQPSAITLTALAACDSDAGGLRERAGLAGALTRLAAIATACSVGPDEVRVVFWIEEDDAGSTADAAAEQ